jgi:hypothetical protein
MPFVFIIEFQVLLTLKANIWMLQMSTRRGSTDVHEFDGIFHGFHARFKVTSVIGHVFRSLFSQIRQQKKKSLFDTSLSLQLLNIRGTVGCLSCPRPAITTENTL